MKLKTHYMFSFGLSSLALTIFGVPLIPTIAISLFVSFVGNIIIDKIGHDMSETGQVLRRSPRTHTVPRSVFWGVVSSLPLLFIIYLIQYDYINLMIASIISGVIVGPSHMLLDSLTEKGIYVKKNGSWERAALAHRKFDDPLGNGLAVISGIVMFVLAFNLSYALL